MMILMLGLKRIASRVQLDLYQFTQRFECQLLAQWSRGNTDQGSSRSIIKERVRNNTNKISATESKHAS